MEDNSITASSSMPCLGQGAATASGFRFHRHAGQQPESAVWDLLFGRETFVNARPVAQNVVQVSAKEIADAPVARVAPAQPVRASVMGAAAPAKARPLQQ